MKRMVAVVLVLLVVLGLEIGLHLAKKNLEITGPQLVTLIVALAGLIAGLISLAIALLYLSARYDRN